MAIAGLAAGTSALRLGRVVPQAGLLDGSDRLTLNVILAYQPQRRETPYPTALDGYRHPPNLSEQHDTWGVLDPRGHTGTRARAETSETTNGLWLLIAPTQGLRVIHGSKPGGGARRWGRVTTDRRAALP